jgi:hypothetical protein
MLQQKIADELKYLGRTQNIRVTDTFRLLAKNI